MALAYYGRDDMSENEIAELMVSALKRTRFEAQIFALEIAKVLAGAMEQMTGQTSQGRPFSQSTRPFPSQGHGKRIHADQMLREMGVKIK